MTDSTMPLSGGDSAEQRAEKHRQLNVVLEGCFDLLNGEITDDAFLKQLATLAGCRSAHLIRWRAGLPETHLISSYGNLDNDGREWIDHLEPLLAAQPGETRLLKGLTGSDRLLSPDRMVYCLDQGPIRVICIFVQRTDGQLWNAGDQQRLLWVMKIIDKPLRTRRQLSWLEDTLKLTNKVKDELPRALLLLTPDGEIMSTNRLANQLIDKNSVMRIRDKRLILTDRGKNQEFSDQLNTVLRLPKDELGDYVWHRNLSDSTAPGSCMLTMLSLPFDNWRLESSARDRVVVIVIQIMDRLAVPTVPQLREFYKLTKSQCNVVAQLLEGNSVEAAADNLHVSINTVRTHLRAIYSKLGVNNKTQLLQRIAGTIVGPKDI